MLLLISEVIYNEEQHRGRARRLAAHSQRLMERDMGAVMYMVIGMVIGSLYAIVVGPTTLKVPQPAMTFADFSIVWFIIGAAAVLALCVCSLTLSLTNR